MALLKEDGSLDVERINNLPREEYKKEMRSLTREQFEEYRKKTPLREHKGDVPIIKVGCTLEEDIERRGLVKLDDYLKDIRKKYGLQ